jgi:hypothetical protein
MVAAYPNSLATSGGAGTTLPQNTDGTDIVLAADVNNAYNEITAIETELGVLPKSRTGAWSTSFSSIYPTTFTSVDARIKNVENGAYAAYTALNFSGSVAYIDGGTSTTF